MNNRKTFQSISLLILIGTALYSSIQYYLWCDSLVVSTNELPDGITQWESRLEKIKHDLPAYGNVGYISDWDLPDAVENTDLETEYRLTQYALSPLVVSRGMGDPLIVGNITAAPFDDALSDYFQVNIIKEYGFGIYLLEKR